MGTSSDPLLHPGTTVLFRAAMLLLVALGLSGCSLIDDIKGQLDDDEDIVHCEPDRPTEIYFSDAIQYNSSQQRWVFHNWKGSGPGGSCAIHVNVHDGQVTLSAAVRQAMASSLTAWRNAIIATGTDCDTYLHFESQGDLVTGVAPRIDLEFVGLLDGGKIAGSTVVTASPAARIFTHVRIQLAAAITIGNDTLTIPETRYPALIAHEFGHAFGILGFDGATGHSTEAEDVMFPTTDCSALSAGDIATMREVYTRIPYYTPVTSGQPLQAETHSIRVVCKH